MNGEKYTITRIEPVPGTRLVNVYFAFGIDSEGSITVGESVAKSSRLDTGIQLQLSRLREQQEQLAAGGE